MEPLFGAKARARLPACYTVLIYLCPPPTGIASIKYYIYYITNTVTVATVYIIVLHNITFSIYNLYNLRVHVVDHSPNDAMATPQIKMSAGRRRARRRSSVVAVAKYKSRRAAATAERGQLRSGRSLLWRQSSSSSSSSSSSDSDSDAAEHAAEHSAAQQHPRPRRQRRGTVQAARASARRRASTVTASLPPFQGGSDEDADSKHIAPAPRRRPNRGLHKRGASSGRVEEARVQERIAQMRDSSGSTSRRRRSRSSALEARSLSARFGDLETLRRVASREADVDLQRRFFEEQERLAREAERDAVRKARLLQEAQEAMTSHDGAHILELRPDAARNDLNVPRLSPIIGLLRFNRGYPTQSNYTRFIVNGANIFLTDTYVEPAAKLFASVLHARPNKFPLKQLEFCGCRFGPTAVATILTAVESNPAVRLERLSFSSNPLGETGALRVSQFLRNADSADRLAELDVSECDIPDKGALYLTEAIIESTELQTLVVLDMSGRQQFSARRVRRMVQDMEVAGVGHVEVKFDSSKSSDSRERGRRGRAKERRRK